MPSKKQKLSPETPLTELPSTPSKEIEIVVVTDQDEFNALIMFGFSLHDSRIAENTQRRIEFLFLDVEQARIANTQLVTEDYSVGEALKAFRNGYNLLGDTQRLILARRLWNHHIHEVKRGL